MVTLPKGKRVISLKWILRIKYTPQGQVDKFKARLVEKGYNQPLGVDYYKSFSLVARTAIIRLVLALVASN